MVLRILFALFAFGFLEFSCASAVSAEGPGDDSAIEEQDTYQSDASRYQEFRDQNDPRAQPRLGPSDPDSLGSTLGTEPDYPLNRDRSNDQDYPDNFEFGSPDDETGQEMLEVD